MLSFFVSQDEARRSGAVPKRVLEVVDLRVMPGTPADTAHPPHVVLTYLDADGGGTLQCRADSRETQQVWIEALQHALKEPERMAQDEINEVQQELLKDAQHHSRAVQQATEAVEAAGRQHREQANAEAALQQNRAIAVELNTQLEAARALQGEALQKLQALQNALEDARHKVHASSIGAEVASSFDQAMEAVERLAAKVEVAASAEATHNRNVELLQLQTKANAREQLELVERMQRCAEESKILRQIAAKSLEEAQRAKQRTKRLASWGDECGVVEGARTRPSQLDPLVEGYLLCQHPMRSSMHRRYYVLIGNTLCWYADQDAYTTKMDAPSGVLHVAEVAEWDGKVKATSPLRRLVVPFGGSGTKPNANEQYPNAFAVLTVEGKTLKCSAPLKKSQEDWISALHVGLTMPPLSPHRARAAKSHRDSFDLLASTPLSPKRQNEEAKKEEAKPSDDSTQKAQEASAAEAESLSADVVVEGYLVGKSSLEEAMKKKYCVLRALTLYVYSTHQEASNAATPEPAQNRRSIRSTLYHICGVSSWDGHATLMHYDHGFIFQTTEHQSIYCSAPSLHEKYRWISGVQQALLKYQHDSKRSSRLFNQLSESEDDEETTGQTQRRLSYGSARREFLAILQRYYAEYHPGKLGDVPMLLARYQGREQALVDHLDRLYGTAMGKDRNVQAILSALVGPIQAPTSHPSPTLSSDSTPLHAPASPAIRTPGDLTDWLTWNKDSSPSFCVLSGNRLERYESEEQSKAAPPLAVFLVTGVHDYPTPSPTIRSTAADQHLQFFLSGGYEVDHHGSSSTELLVLQASTDEAKQKWMLKLRSGIATVSAEPSPKVEPSSTVPKETELPMTISTQATKFREKLVEFYQRHNPKRAGDVETLLTSFAGRERQLLASLDATYGTNVSSDGSFAAFLPQPSPSNARPSRESAPIHREGYLAVKHPRLGTSFRKCFCVLEGTSWQCFESSVVAHSGRQALLSDQIVSLHPVSAKLAETLAFPLETQTNGVILLRSDAAEIVHDWIQTLRSAIASQPSAVEMSEVKEKEGPRSSFEQLRTKITAFYEKYSPSKVSDVDSLLDSFQGREGALLEQIDTVYKTHLATDPECTSLCADLAAKYAEEHQSASPAKPSTEAPDNESILMEGYLMKRGHKIPSMRKRYCVLVGNELSYYVTHDDSKNPGGGATTNPLGNFRVEIVGDWHGKTAAYTYEHGMELETTDGKTFFCAASSANEKQQWIDAFRRGIALARNEQRRAELEDQSDNNDHQQQQFREKLADFYRVRNPAKLPDLDLLLSCYAQRELALLQAIDEAYGTSLAADETLLSLLPPLPEQAAALATLKLDGYLKKTAGDNMNSLWKRAQSVYVAIDGLTINLFATREGFKSGGAGLGGSMTILAVKDDDSRQSAVNRFAVETSDHEWLRFEAKDTMEKRLWVQVLRAALDTVLAQSLLADNDNTDPRGRASGVAVDARGFLLLRLDFDCTQEEHWKRREQATSIEERGVALENSNEFVIIKSTSSEKKGEEQARFRVVSTRAWAPSARCWPVTASNRAPRFPFQIVTQEQFVLSCSAATDAERAKWIRHLRLGAEQAAALEMLEEQLLETTAPLSPGRRSLVDRRERGFNDGGGVVVPRQPVSAVQKEEEEEPPMTGYLSFRLAQSPLSAGEVRHASQVPIPREGFVVLDMRAHVAVYDDESAYYRQDAPACQAQAVELLCEGVASLAVTTHSPKTKSTLRHFFPGAKEVVSSSLAFAVLLHPLRGDGNASADDMNNDHDEQTAMLELFPTLPSQRDLWMEALSNRIDFARGEALLADEKIMLKLERDEEVQEIVEEKKKEMINEPNNDGSGANSESGDDGSTDDSGFEDTALTIDVSQPSEEPRGNLLVQSDSAASFVFRTAAMEGLLTPWQTSTSPIRLPGSSKMKPMTSVYAVLVGCQLRCYSSREAAAGAATANTSRNLLAAAEGEPPSLDVDIIACTPWEAPNASWLTIGKESENLGFKIDVKGSRHGVCFTAMTMKVKHQWIQAIQHELNFVVAERSLSISERQFTQEVAAHLASIAASTAAAEANAAGADSNPTKVEGYLRVRHHNLGSIWRNRFVVLEGSKLSIYWEDHDEESKDDENDLSTPVEEHELVGVEKWRPVFATIGRNGGNGLKGTGFRIETSSGVYLECTATTADEASRWRAAITAATTKETTADAVSRDASLPYIPGARMEGYLKLKDPQKSAEKKKSMKMKPLKLWKTRYCVVMGSHWLVYANQSQAISSGEAPTPVAVYELLGIVVAGGDDENCANEFSIQVVPGRHVKCRARSSLERKRWVNAVEDEIMTQAKTSEDLERSKKEREQKLAAREAVKSKMHEVKTDARRLSALLGEAIQSACADADSDYDSDAHENSSEEDSSQRQRSGPDYIDGSPESSPMRRNGGEPAFPFDTLDIAGSSSTQQASPSPLAGLFACFFRCLPVSSAGASGRNVIAPLGIPGYPSTAAACNAQYTCDYYQDDGYRGVA
ncbi:unnamed protein product [Phytophthora fragariaefolia]|uniref:Unnamed protein product n=1 Tax=Phytophthora fragariaefolia TaxID=1490495 RepID=A0A9W6XUD0_9STRA|nr:unnamed protein product [Phytophthora fragariaefolia]